MPTGRSRSSAGRRHRDGHVGTVAIADVRGDAGRRIQRLEHRSSFGIRGGVLEAGHDADNGSAVDGRRALPKDEAVVIHEANEWIASDLAAGIVIEPRDGEIGELGLGQDGYGSGEAAPKGCRTRIQRSSKSCVQFGHSMSHLTPQLAQRQPCQR